MYVAVERGFAVEKDSFKSALGQIIADGRLGFNNGIPIDTTVQRFCAQKGT